MVRSGFHSKATVGDLYADGVWAGFTLEDRVREGPKVYGETAIPEGCYEVMLTHSPRFKRVLPLLIDVPGFDGIRIHPGNTHEDTQGCILIGEGVVPDADSPRLSKSVSAFTRLFELMEKAEEKGEPITIEIRSTEAA